MAGPAPQNLYQPFNQTASEVPETDSPRFGRFDVRATPEDMGANVGGALQQAGKTGEQVGNEAIQIANEFAKTATETKASNDFANIYSQKAGALRSQFDQLNDQDKIAGSAAYIKGLQDLGQSFTGDDSQGSPLYKQVMGQLIGRHVFSEVTGVDREVVGATIKASAESKDNLMAANNGYAAANYNNPQVAQQMTDANYGLITIKHEEAGHDLENPATHSLIDEAHKNVTGDMAVGMINRAVAAGDVPAANDIRANYSPYIPGYKQLQIDNFLNSANTRANVTNGMAALTNGQPLPEMHGAPLSNVQSLVANTAHTNGVDPNEALTVARIESSYGENVGARGTIGQDKGSAGQTLDVQAKALCDNWKSAKTTASSTLGRPAEGWESYTVYQQGAGGGGALLKADPNARAVDILRPLYKNPQDALDAITKNGGNATMSVSDFLGQEKKRYNDNFARAQCDFKDTSPPGDQIAAPHQTAGVTVQPGANPIEDYHNWQKANIVTMGQIMTIPNGPLRQAMIEDNRQKTAVKEGQANAYKSDIMQNAYKLMADPSVTSMTQVPPDLASTLFEYNPQGYIALENRIRENGQKSDPSQRDALEKGPAFHELNIGTEEGTSKRTTVDDINQAYNDGKINSSAQDYLISKVAGKKSLDPNEANYKKNALELAKSTLQYQTYDPASVASYSNFSMALDDYVNKSKSEGKSLHDIYNSKNLEPLIKQFEPKYTDTLPKPEADKGSFLHRMFSSASEQPAFPKPQELVANQVYDTPKYGKLLWTGTGFVKPKEGQ